MKKPKQDSKKSYIITCIIIFAFFAAICTAMFIASVMNSADNRRILAVVLSSALSVCMLIGYCYLVRHFVNEYMASWYGTEGEGTFVKKYGEFSRGDKGITFSFKDENGVFRKVNHSCNREFADVMKKLEHFPIWKYKRYAIITLEQDEAIELLNARKELK